MKNNKIFVCLLCIFGFLSLATIIHADYVLPYPSYMPGNKLYKVSRILDILENYWNFGAVAQTKFHLELADKYLVEAKTLFEYKQYLLATDALNRSDNQFSSLPVHLVSVKNEGVDTTQLHQTIQEAAVKHTDVLEALLAVTPVTFNWTPEKSQPTMLDVHALIQQAIAIRSSVSGAIKN